MTIELPQPKAQPAETAPIRVLLVDDEAGVRRSVSRLLRRAGFSVTEASGGEAALDLLRQGRLDVVLSDLRMPGLSGEDFFERIRKEFPSLLGRVVFTSGDTECETTRAFLTRTGCPALQKPYELSELVGVLRSLRPIGIGEAGSRRTTA